MNKYLWLIVIFFVGYVPLYAADVDLEWEPVLGAAGYEVEMSVDSGDLCSCWGVHRDGGNGTWRR